MIAFFLILIPLATGLLTFFIKDEKTAQRFAFLATLVTLTVSLLGLTLLKTDDYLIFNAPWMSTLGSSFALKLDGLGQVLCLLTAVAYPLTFVGTWRASYKKAHRFFALMLLAQAGMMGVFLAADALLFYFFWELALIPMYFLASQWGGEKRIAVTFRFFVYTFFGSLLVLIGILYVHV